MTNIIPIISDLRSSEELHKLLQTTNTSIQFELHPSDQPTRSILSDPSVVVALINAGAVTVAALIGLFGVVWSTKRKEKKNDNEVVIEIKIKADKIKDLKTLNEAKQQILAKLFDESNIDSEKLRLPNLGEVDLNQTYEEVLKEIMLEDVEYVTILEDE